MRIGYDAKRIFHNASGLGNYGRDIIRILSTHYPENKYVLFNTRPDKLKRFKFCANTFESLPEDFIGRNFPAYWRRFSIKKQIQKENLDLFHGLSGELPHNIITTGVPSIVTIHDLIFMRYPQWYSVIDRTIYTMKARKACKESNHIIAISHQTKNDIVELLNISPDKISVTYQTCHPAFKDDHSDEILRSIAQKYSLPKQFILTVSTVEERKNLLTIVKSLFLHQLPLFVVGSRGTNYFKKVKNFIAENNLQNRVYFLDDITMQELAIIYRLATVFCYPSIIEGFGIPVIEALYSKTPVITSLYGCFKEAGGPDSFYIDAFDYKALANIIVQLQQDESLYKSVAEKGYEYVQRFNDDVIAGEMMQVYKQVLRKEPVND